jgi:exosortase B
MSAVRSPSADTSPAVRAPLWPPGVDRVAIAVLLAGLACLFIPTYVRLASTVWASDEQGHGPIILGVSLWLLYQLRAELSEMPSNPAPAAGWTLVGLGLVLYALGRSQDIIMFEVGAQVPIFAGLLLVFKGVRALRAAWFPLFFLLFMVPLPGGLVAAVTTPLKSAVSYVASNLLYVLGYPVGRSGVVLTVGPYQLLVADACAGLNSMFTLEALGLLYMNLMAYTSPTRNIALAVLIIPIAFLANIVRVLVLVLVTYYFGDEAGQGFVHGFAGMVLFMVGLMLMLATDRFLALFIPAQAARAAS